jgi:hypothetical protein
MHKEVEEKSLVELAPSNEVASAYLVHMLEARFASLNPFMQYIFLKLHEIEDPKKKASRMPIPCKLVGIHNALVTNSSWICPENLLDENSVPRRDYKGYSKPQLDSIHFFVPIVDPEAPFIIT